MNFNFQIMKYLQVEFTSVTLLSADCTGTPTWYTEVFTISVVARAVSRHCPRETFVADQDDGGDGGDRDDYFVADAVYAVVVPDLHFFPEHDGNHESCICKIDGLMQGLMGNLKQALYQCNGTQILVLLLICSIFCRNIFFEAPNMNCTLVTFLMWKVDSIYFHYIE